MVQRTFFERFNKSERTPAAQPVRTSIAAAEAIADIAPTIRGRVKELLPPVEGKPKTHRRLGLIYDSGETRAGSSGCQQVVLKAKR